MIQEEDRYDFLGWYSLAFTGRGFFDIAQAKSIRVKKAMGNIQEGVLNTLEALFAKRPTPEEVTVDGLRSKLELFFSDVRSFAQVDFENISTLSNIIQSTQDALVAWGKSCTRQG